MFHCDEQTNLNIQILSVNGTSHEVLLEFFSLNVNKGWGWKNAFIPSSSYSLLLSSIIYAQLLKNPLKNPIRIRYLSYKIRDEKAKQNSNHCRQCKFQELLDMDTFQGNCKPRDQRCMYNVYRKSILRQKMPQFILLVVPLPE